KQIGLQYLSWEPMSVKREYGETIAETERIQKLLQGSAIPILICLDVSHGDLSSQNPDDHDYAKWVEKFAAISPLIHLKQVMAGTSAHLPFTTENNMKGKIRPETLLPMLEKYGAKNALLLLELAFREREPTESLILQQLQESADYWKRGMNNHGINL
ncbi:hypothetical protein CMO92_03460, partial [Candidatus Woesearchaeota archaeon]|nr:hypothetical protein [Candidatus Woesearchaeota archaeon]